MSFVVPCNENNAIKNAAFALEFPEEINEQVVLDLVKLYEENDKLLEELPRKQINNAITLNLNNPNKPSVPTIDGVTFDSLTRSGEQEWAIILRRNAIIVSCGKYTRWADVLDKVKVYFDFALQVLGDKSLGFVGLEYVDEFQILDNTKDWKGDLLNSSSKYLPSSIFDLSDFWHSHHGFMSDRNIEGIKQTLNNFNVDYIHEMRGTHGAHKVIMRTQHKTQLDSLVNFDDSFWENTVSGIFNQNHSTNKDIFRDVLTENMRKKINLGD